MQPVQCVCQDMRSDRSKMQKKTLQYVLSGHVQWHYIIFTHPLCKLCTVAEEGAIWEEQMPWRAPCDHFLNEGLPPPSLGRAQCIWSHTNVFEFSSGSAFLRSWLRILFNRDRLCGWSYQPIYQHRQAPKSMNRRRLNGGGTSSASNDFESHSECPAGLGWLGQRGWFTSARIILLLRTSTASVILLLHAFSASIILLLHTSTASIILLVPGVFLLRALGPRALLLREEGLWACPPSGGAGQATVRC